MSDKQAFNPDDVSLADSDIFGLPKIGDKAQIVLIPAPWGVTVSYGGGTHNGPKAILDASTQLDYYHESYGADAWRLGISMLPLKDWEKEYKEGVALRKKAEKHIRQIEQGKKSEPKEINAACEKFHARIEKTAAELLEKKKLVGLVGGDHSTPLGLMRALAKKHDNFGILQIDAHCDLREAYEGFTYSHASIMWNALKLPQIKKLVQVGIRDYSGSERQVIEKSNGRIKTFFDADIKERQFKGDTWRALVEDIVAALPEKVYISFDIDGLDPALCPHTGTPVAGGLQFQEAAYLIRAVAKSGKKIIGFDLNEVSPSKESEWNENVGMRILWNLIMWAAKSNGLKSVM